MGPQDHYSTRTVSTFVYSTCVENVDVHASYVLTLILKKMFMLKCNLSMLRLTPMLSLAALPVALTSLVCYHKREHPPASITTPLLEAVVLASFPLAWFFGFLYYTEVPSVVSVVLTVVYASRGKHWSAAMVRFFCLNVMPDSASRRTSMLDRPCQLHVPPEQHNMGAVRLRIQPAYVPPVPAFAAQHDLIALGEAPRSPGPRGAARYVCG